MNTTIFSWRYAFIAVLSGFIVGPAATYLVNAQSSDSNIKSAYEERLLVQTTAPNACTCGGSISTTHGHAQVQGTITQTAPQPTTNYLQPTSQPVVGSITIDAVSLDGNSLTLSGSGFTSYNKVTFSGADDERTVAVGAFTSSKLVFAVPADLYSGDYTVTVTNSRGSSSQPVTVPL